ncbi:PQQ-binding-like beta-propeller repeat protein [Dactylosporangium sp. AC04546]|uniref:outer membrane protein assembly factor BamB family protein n=1 Tax=Dactylosporangium sp. AC04546 TaxID=2862460 RepID=UPI001EDCAFB5|nr:PQQ-binding-like beta-propeller repeat protein [Dactylosporangium sp. AC04546]WVK85427.1 PQQ-binding-like beta-propeller repeat protein [Dactylosporangium sp. AC04546]
MPEPMIELDLTTPWEPVVEAGASPNRQRRRRAGAAVLVGVVAAGLLTAAAPARAYEPLFALDYQVTGVYLAGGRVFAGRYKRAGAGQELEAFDARNGRLLWSLQMAQNQYVRSVTAGVVVLLQQRGEPDDAVSDVAVHDAATGERLWQRESVWVFGRFGGRMLIDEMVDGEVPERQFVVDENDDGVIRNQAPELREQHLLALDERTGTVEWRLDVPKGNRLSFELGSGWEDLTGMVELTPAGELRRHDPRDGVVTRTDRLDWSGAVSWFEMDGAEVVVFRVGDVGGDVYDLASGRRLWHWQDPEHYGGLGSCWPGLYCVQGQSGTTAVDRRTGRTVWRLQQYNSILGLTADAMIMSVWESPDLDPRSVAAVDPRTGQATTVLEGWNAVQLDGPRIVVWKTVGQRDAVLAELDPATGRVAVFGRAHDWFGRPSCVTERRTLACVVVGGLTVWRLP